jgi:diguanylate cyclase (GGDEF)-like protein
VDGDGAGGRPGGPAAQLLALRAQGVPPDDPALRTLAAEVVLAATGAPAILLEADGALLAASPTAAAMLSLAPARPGAALWAASDVLAPVEVEALREAVAVAADGTPARWVIELRTAAAGPELLELVCRPVMADDGSPSGLVLLEGPPPPAPLPAGPAAAPAHHHPALLYDASTGLARRELVVDELEHALLRAARRGRHVGLVLVDVDVAHVESRLGRPAVEEVVASVGRRVRQVLRAEDVAGRIAADEVVAVLEDVVEQSVVVDLAGRLQESLRAPVLVHDVEVAVPCSLGVAVSRPRSTAESLLRDADVARYRARRHGGNRAEVYDAETRQVAVRRHRLAGELRAAVPGVDLVLHQQAVVELTTWRQVGTELLLRWRGPDGAVRRAVDFVDVLDGTDLAVPVGAWVLDEACRLLHTSAAGAVSDEPSETRADDLFVSVNLAGRQLDRDGVTELVRATLERHQVDPSRLVLEVTEHDALGRGPAAAEEIRALQGLGCRLALDDVGTGAASLTALVRLGADFLKLDRSIVAALPSDEAAQAVAAAVVGLAGRTSAPVVAEGIETEEQLAAAVAAGCRLGQGYLLGRPHEIAPA